MNIPYFLCTKDGWAERKRPVLSKVYHNLETLVDEARDTRISTSLAVFKPERITSFRIEHDLSLRSRARKRKVLAQQLPEEEAEKLVEAVPFKFFYTFVDQLGKRSTLQILDWEIYQLCRKLIRKIRCAEREN